MTAKPGVLHDPLQELAQVLSETDVGATRELLVEPIAVVGQAEASVVSAGIDATLTDDGMSVRALAGGPLVDRHNDYRHQLGFKEPYDGCARFALQDNVEYPALTKGRDELWSMHEFDVISVDNEYLGYPYHDAHYDGQTLYHAVIRKPVPADPEVAVYVATKNDSDSSWGTYAQVTDTENLILGSYEIGLAPTFLTIPDIGTLLFYFGFETKIATGYRLQVVKIMLTRDHGQSWEVYGSFPIEPYYGAVNMTGAVRPYAYECHAVLKATFYNNKILLGMMLSGCETTTITTGKYNIARILNLVFSTDMGKSWSTAPYEFISASIKGVVPVTPYNLGSISSSTETFKAPASFGLGVEPDSDRAILVFHPAGDVQSASPIKAWEWENVGGLVAYYNVSDDLYEWEHAYAGPRCFRLIDSFDVDRLANNYFLDQPGGVANWHVAGGKLIQDADYAGGSYPAARAYLSSQVILKTGYDPTCEMVLGIRCRITCSAANSSYNCDVGIGYARTDRLNFRAINIDCQYNAAAAGGKIYISTKWVVAGVETTKAWAPVLYVPADTEFDLTILFRGQNLVTVYVDGKMAIDDFSAGTMNPGEIFLYCNGTGPSTSGAQVSFNDLGLLVGYGYSAFPGTYLPTRVTSTPAKVGQNIDVVVDDNNHAWISADTSNICLWDDSGYNRSHFAHGIVLSRIRLAREVEREENKPLGKEKFVLKFELEGDSCQDVASAFNVFERGIFNVWVSYAVVGVTGPFLDRFIWHRTGPMFFVKRLTGATEMTAVIRRAPYSNITVSPKFVSMFHRLTTTSALPLWAGWDYSGSFVDGSDNTAIRVATDGTGYFRQVFDYTTGYLIPVDGATEWSCPIQLLDIDARGFIVYFRTKSYDGNSPGAIKTVFECRVPNMAKTSELRLRITCYEGSSYAIQRWNGSTWTNITALFASTSVWTDFLVFVAPSNITDSGFPELTVCHKPATDATWRIELDGWASPIIATFSPYRTLMQFGCFDGSGAVCQQEFKVVGYTDSCLVDPKKYPIIGEPTESGEAIEFTQNVALAFANGQPATNDEWLVTAVNARVKPADNVLDRPGVLWRSDDDDADKQIVLDHGLKHDFDTIVLTGVNCQHVRIEANSQNNWTSPPFSVTLDLTQYADVPYRTIAGKNWLLRHSYASNDWLKDALVGRRFVCEDLTYGAFRVRSNVDNYIVYERDAGPSLPTLLSDRLMNVLSDRIALRLFERQQYQFFRLTFYNDGLAYATPEGWFQLGAFVVGMFSEFMDWPQYPESTPRIRPSDQIRLGSGALRTLKRGARVRERTLNFDGVRNDRTGLKAQLELLHRDSQGRRPMFYCPQIDRYVLAGIGTYDFEVQPCTLSAPFEQSINGGWLTSVRLLMSDSR